MKTYLIRVLYCGEDLGNTYFFESDKEDVLDILKDFLDDGEELDDDYIVSNFIEGEDIVELLVCMNDYKVLINNGEVDKFVLEDSRMK